MFKKHDFRARICKRLRIPGINSGIAYVAWRTGTTNRVVVRARQAGNRFLGSLQGLKIQAQMSVRRPPSPLPGAGESTSNFCYSNLV